MSAEKSAAKGLGGQYLSFTLGGEDYGVEILKVQEIRGWEAVRPLPNSPHHIKGVLDLRGVIVPIVDLRGRFGLTEREYTRTTVIIVLSVSCTERPHVVGVVVDAVSDVLDVKDSEVKPPPNLGSHISYEYLIGMISQQGRMVVLLNSDKLFGPEELAVAMKSQ